MGSPINCVCANRGEETHVNTSHFKQDSFIVVPQGSVVCGTMKRPDSQTCSAYSCKEKVAYTVGFFSEKGHWQVQQNATQLSRTFTSFESSSWKTAYLLGGLLPFIRGRWAVK